jgi:hypothetical protein
MEIKTFYVTIYLCTSSGLRTSNIPLYNQVGIRGTSKEDVKNYFEKEWIHDIYAENPLFKRFPDMAVQIDKIETLEEMRATRIVESGSKDWI